MKKDSPSYEELQQDHARHWKDVGRIRDERYQVNRQMLARPWVCQKCGTRHACGGVCPKCREARLIEVE